MFTRLNFIGIKMPVGSSISDTSMFNLTSSTCTQQQHCFSWIDAENTLCRETQEGVVQRSKGRIWHRIQRTEKNYVCSKQLFTWLLLICAADKSSLSIRYQLMIMTSTLLSLPHTCYHNQLQNEKSGLFISFSFSISFCYMVAWCCYAKEEWQKSK